MVAAVKNSKLSYHLAFGPYPYKVDLENYSLRCHVNVIKVIVAVDTRVCFVVISVLLFLF